MQTLEQLLPPAEIGTAQLNSGQIMKGFVIYAAVVVAFGGMYAANAPRMLAELDAATAQQCAKHDWPVHQHQRHMEWCAANGYRTN